jgi:hypothetical protein
MAAFCHKYCGVCAACQQAMAELEREEDAYRQMAQQYGKDFLTTRPDPDDPRTYALDHKGQP